MPRLIWLLGLVFVTVAARAEFEIETVAEGLDHPWSLAFLPDGDMLLTERGGRLRRIGRDGLVAEPVANTPATYVAGQGGYFDIVPDPDFATNALVYLSFAHGEPKKNALRVVRAKLDGNTLTGVTPIFTVVPWKDTPHHYGGRMAFLSDGTLLITTGEGFTYREASQTLDNHFGKVVRIRTDGGVPADNPFIGSDGARPEVWTFGHRNPQAVVVVPGSGTVYLHEHGPRGGDELNLIVPGRNYGWPAITYGIDYSGATVSPYTELPGMEQPLVYWVPSIAPAGMAWYDGALFPDWRGNLLIASLAERTIRRVELRNGSVIAQHVIFDDLGERFRDVRVGPDGAVYLLTDSPSGRVLKVTPRE